MVVADRSGCGRGCGVFGLRSSLGGDGRRSSRAEYLLPLLLIPVLAPVLLAGSRAFETALGIRADAGWSWTSLMFVIAAVHTVVGLAAFGFLLEES